VFDGTDNGSNGWMDVGVRATGGGTFTVLTPRQPILPVPYALFATSASNLLGSLAATQIVGSLPSSLVSGAYSSTVNFVSGANTFAGAFAGNGASLTNLNAANLAGGAIASPLLSGSYSNTVNFLNGSNTFAGAFAGNGASLTNLNAANLAGGAIASPLLSGSYSNTVNFLNGSNTFAGTFAGNGASLTNLNAANLASGTVADARLSSNVALLNQNQTFTGTNLFIGTNKFNGASTFTGTTSLVGTNNLTGTNTLLGGNLLSGINTMAGTNVLSGTNLFTGASVLVGANTLAGTNTFAGVSTFNSTTIFTGTNTFTASNTFAGPGNYIGVNTFTNFGNSFVGSFFGNGLVGWQAVSGTSQQAVRDNGYMLTSVGFTTVTLPSSPLNSVDIVRLSGAGPGGWRAVGNSGQTIIGNFASYSNCFPVELQNGSYTGVAASADGVHMFAVGATGFTGVYASANSGVTWSLIPAVNLNGFYLSVACSANGRIVYAEPTGTSTAIMKSTDGGTTWAATGPTATGNAISCTADGSKVFTTDYACSGNGTYLTRLTGTTISFSTNAGSTWFNLPNAPANISCVAASSDCTRLVAGVSGSAGGLLYASANQGLTWSALTVTNQIWSGAWMSPDGTKLAASATTSGVIGGGVFYGTVIPQPNTISTNVIGSQGSAVELQYIGNNQFVPVGSTGLLWAN
jgi:hypothetical protein